MTGLCVDDPAIRKLAHELMRASGKAHQLRSNWNSREFRARG
jgi:hypothetical protein